jgi:hypothetical protein
MRQRILERQPNISVEELEARCVSAEFERDAAKKYCSCIIDATLPLENVVNLVILALENCNALCQLPQ